MRISLALNPTARKYVAAKLSAGEYASLGEMINVALAHLQAEDDAWSKLSKGQLQKLRREIGKGLASIERGEVSDFDADDIRREGRKILASRRKRAS